MQEEQLNLDLQIRQDASLSDFAGAGWLAIIDIVRQMHMGLIKQLYLYGEHDTGKTHLLTAICESFREMGQSVIYLSLRELLAFDPLMLSSLERMAVIAIDDMDVIQGHSQWQEAIFHLINLSQEHDTVLIFASRIPVNQLDFSLKDLISRLSKATTFQLPSGHDRQDRALILHSVLKRRNWHLDPRIIDHLLKEGPHRIGAMLGVLNQLQPLLSNLERAHVTKAKIQQAIKTIDDQTLLYELQDIEVSEDPFLDF